MNHTEHIANELGIHKNQVQNTINLINNGATVPFIARYRKEITGSLDEVIINKIRDKIERLKELDKRRESIIKTIKQQGKLTDELEKQLCEAEKLSELEDIYLPYRPKRKTRAAIAKSRGLEPLAKMIMCQKYFDINKKASEFISEKEKVYSIDDALSGARDIIAEWINENRYARTLIRNLFLKEAVIYSKIIKNKEEEGVKYKTYFDYKESINKVPSHRILAMMRGKNEGFLKLTIAPDREKAIEILEGIFIKQKNTSADHVKLAVKDCYRRLLKPSMELEMKTLLKNKADEQAIKVFSENLRQLLLIKPLGQKNVLAIDPGYKSGCKLVCLDKQGRLVHNETIYPHPPQSKVKLAIHKIKSLVNAYKIEAIAIGNGTAGRETENLIRRIRFDKDIIAVMVNESGASVYSASAAAREEFPEYDITVRGAVSIGRRLIDPLAELVKIDPKSIGVGQYQHDVKQLALNKSLKNVVISCVNSVGVEINTASKQLLTYVSGIGPYLAENIVKYKNKYGDFKSREEFKDVPGFGKKAFEQAAGFLRIRKGENILDQSAVHPESYQIVYKMAAMLNCTINDLIRNENLCKKINIKEFVTAKAGLPTLKDIMKELAKPGRDPRTKIGFFEFDKNVKKIEDIKPGMKLPGIITNITDFGAFVDIGVHQDGLIHISQLADEFIKNPNDIVKINQKVIVKVLSVDVERKRIQLSLKDL